MAISGLPGGVTARLTQSQAPATKSSHQPISGRLAQLKRALATLTSKLRSNVASPSLKTAPEVSRLSSIKSAESPKLSRLPADACAPQNLRKLTDPAIKSDSQLNQKAQATSKNHEKLIHKQNIKADVRLDYRPATHGKSLGSIPE